MGILELLLGGGATGLLGTIVSQVMSIFQSSEDRKKMALEFEHEIRLQEMQLASLKEETEREIMIEETKASTAAYTAAMQHDTSFGQTSAWVTDLRALFRPAITMFLCMLTALIYVTSSDMRIQYTITDAVVFCTIAAISFWFADRSIAKNVTGYRKLPWQ